MTSPASSPSQRPAIQRAIAAVVFGAMGTCDTVHEFLLEYRERHLPWLTRWRYGIHLSICPPCKRYLDRYDTAVALAQAVENDPPPQELTELTRKFLRTRAQK